MRPRILIVGDGAAHTGFARVVQGVFTPLAGKYDLHQLAINHWGDPHDWPWDLYPANRNGDPLGGQRLGEVLARLTPDLVFVLNDVWSFPLYAPALAAHRPRPLTVFYCPVEAGPLSPAHVAPLRQLDRIVLYTRFGRQVIEEAARDGSLRLPPLEVIPHGVDAETFAPLSGDVTAEAVRESRTRARHELLPAMPELHDAFIVLNANRNQPRKRIDLTLEAFALFARDKPPGVKLFLHMGLEDFGWDIPTLGRRLGIYDRLIVTSQETSIPRTDSSYLNTVYNACDVGINTAMAEGWGLVAFEHAATGAAQIVPGFGPSAELWQGAAELLPAGRTMTQEKTLMECHLIEPADAAMALQRLYDSPAYRQQMTEAAHARATRPENRWTEVSRRWDSLFEEMLAERTRARALRKHAPDARIRPPYIFLHIPKTGGTSLGDLLGAYFGDAFEHYWAPPETVGDGKTCVIGHFPHGLHRLFREPATYFTMLRNPYTRVLSQYFYNRDTPHDPWHELARDHPLEEWLDLHPDAQNLQVQFVSGRKGPPPDRETLDLAKRNLAAFGFVGLMEDFEATLLLLRHVLGVDTLQHVRLRQTPSRPRLDQIAPEVLAKVQRLNALDFELYRLGQQLFLEKLQAVVTRRSSAAPEDSPQKRCAGTSRSRKSEPT